MAYKILVLTDYPIQFTTECRGVKTHHISPKKGDIFFTDKFTNRMKLLVKCNEIKVTGCKDSVLPVNSEQSNIDVSDDKLCSGLPEDTKSQVSLEIGKSSSSETLIDIDSSEKVEVKPTKKKRKSRSV